jgi:glycosyltransferase involved in cell wall biosynthesis
MNSPLLIVYSNLGLGGMPKRLVDIVNSMSHTHPKTPVYLMLKERRAFDLRTEIHNPLVTIYDFYGWCPVDNAFIFLLWVWVFILVHNPKTILSFISPYALPVLATKILFFWRKTRIIINEGHYTSTMVLTMMLPAVQSLGIRLLYPLADALIVPTAAIQNDLRKSYGISGKNITIIPNWTAYAQTPLRKNRRIYDMVYAGRIDTTKNIIPLIEITPVVSRRLRRPVRFLLMGDGPDTDRCTKYISDHGLSGQVVIHPPVTNINDYLSQANIFIFKPDRATEGFPVAILDAMACGAVVVTGTFNGVGETVRGDCGFVVSTTDELVSRVVSIIKNRTKQSGRILRAKRLVMARHSLKNAELYTRMFNL